jgi:putative glutamine amidotransferase
MVSQRPLIGITTRHELDTERFYLARFYAEAVEAAGGAPLHLPLIPRKDYIADVVKNLQGILLPGSASDVDPLRYGEEPHERLGSVHPLRDETDLLILDELETKNLPLLAICFGIQILNVHRGGSLIQDIGAQHRGALKHEQGMPRERRSHRVQLKPDGFLSRLAGDQEALVNSHHHQAIKELGRDLSAEAWSPDGLIEAVEDPRDGRWIKGVQWHPEIGWKDDAFSRELFASFVDASRRHAKAAGR